MIVIIITHIIGFDFSTCYNIFEGEIMQQKIRLNDILEIDVKRMGINGEGIGYYERLAIFIDNALPGEKVLAQITEVYPNRAIAKVLETIEKSPNRVKPLCPVYDACGGCQVQHFDYNAMLLQKKDIIKKALDRYVKRYDAHIISDTIGMDNPKNYRNKASLPLRLIDNKNRFGMFARNSNAFVPINTCGVQHTKINDIFTTMTSLMDRYHIDAYDLVLQTGIISHAIVRITENLNEVQVTFILPKAFDGLDNLVHELVKLHPEIMSIYKVINPDVRQSYFTEDIHLIYGKEMIEEQLGGHTFSLSPDAFFQLNTSQADKFYNEMKRLAQIKPTEIVVDAYAGIAPISHYIGQDAKHIYAIEINEDAVKSAKISLDQNHIDNVTVIENNFEDALDNLKDIKIDVMLFDPPRSGLGEDVIQTILKYKPKRLVYGSCNPSTLAKDLSLLLEDYDLKHITPIDMFPYTSLVESISLLVLR